MSNISSSSPLASATKRKAEAGEPASPVAIEAKRTKLVGYESLQSYFLIPAITTSSLRCILPPTNLPPSELRRLEPTSSSQVYRRLGVGCCPPWPLAGVTSFFLARGFFRIQVNSRSMRCLVFFKYRVFFQPDRLLRQNLPSFTPLTDYWPS